LFRVLMLGGLFPIFSGVFFLRVLVCFSRPFCSCPTAHPLRFSAAVAGEMRSTAFTVTVNGRKWMWSSSGQLRVCPAHITARWTCHYRCRKGFWDRGVDIHPGGWASGNARTPDHPLHLGAPASSPSRGRRLLNYADALCSLAGSPPAADARDPASMLQAGSYHQSLNPKSGETL